MKTAADLPIANACPLEGELPGEGPSRHCATCDTLVVDLSLLTSDDADALLRSPTRPRCFSYLVDDRGAVLHLPPAPVARRRLPILAGAILLAACNGALTNDPPPTTTASATAPIAATAATPTPPVLLRGEPEAQPHAPPAASAMAGDESCEHDGKPPTAAAATASATRPHTPPVSRPIMKRGKPMRLDHDF